MSRAPLPADALLRAALAPASEITAPPSLPDEIAAAIRRTPQDHRLLRLPWGSDLGRSWVASPDRRLAWALLVAALGVALVAGLLVGAGLWREGRLALVPTGVESLTAESTRYDDVLTDGAGTLWAVGPGHVTRFDPGTGERRTWTVSDDLAFDAHAVSVARAGGLWLWCADGIRRFDGQGFAETIPAPGDVWSAETLVEDPDGVLWAYLDGGLRRWDGAAWAPLPELPSSATDFMFDSLTVLAGGDAWVGLTTPSNYGRLEHLVGDTWVGYGIWDVTALAGSYSVAGGPDGSLWVGSSRGLARFSNGTWQEVERTGFGGIGDIAVDGQGAVWLVENVYQPRVGRFEDGVWTIIGSGSSLTGQAAQVAGIAANEAGVFLATGRGLVRLVDGEWVPAWPNTAIGPSDERMGSFKGWILGVSAQEAWVPDDEGLWHYRDGRWTGPELAEAPSGWGYNESIDVGPDGSVFLVNAGGLAVRRDGGWETAWKGEASSVSAAPDGSVWLADGSHSLIQLREVDGAWVPRAVTCPAGGGLVRVTTDGMVWTGGISYGGVGGLARFDGRTCELAGPAQDNRALEVTGLEAGPSGALVATVFEPRDDGQYRESITQFDGRRWTSLRAETLPFLRLANVAVSPSGEVWLAGYARGIERYREGAWTDAFPGLQAAGPISFAPDGTLWFAGPSGIQRVQAELLP